MTQGEMFTALSKTSGQIIEKIEVDEWVHITINNQPYTIYADTRGPFHTPILAIAIDSPPKAREINLETAVSFSGLSIDEIEKIQTEAQGKINIILNELRSKLGTLEATKIDIKWVKGGGKKCKIHTTNSFYQK